LKKPKEQKIAQAETIKPSAPKTPEPMKKPEEQKKETPKIPVLKLPGSQEKSQSPDTKGK
jgi:hypothetical protein